MNSPEVFPNAQRDCACSCHLYRNKCLLQFCALRFSNNHHGLYSKRTGKCFQKVYYVKKNTILWTKNTSGQWWQSPRLIDAVGKAPTAHPGLLLRSKMPHQPSEWARLKEELRVADSSTQVRQLLLNQMSEFKVRKIGETERLQRSANDGRLSQQGSSNSNPNEPQMPQWNRRRTLVGAQKQRLHPTPLSHARKFESQKIPLGSFSLVPLRDWWRRHSRPCNKWANTQINPILPVNALSI